MTLLAVDIGNTAIKFGVFEIDGLRQKFVLQTHRDQTSADLKRLLDEHLADSPTNVIVSSVVPKLDAVIIELFPNARIVKPTDDLGLTFNFPLDTAGTDHLINSFAAVELYGAPCIVISFGTATTIDVINKDREHLGGLIAPGPKATAKALEIITSKLPEVEIAEPANVVNTTTEGAIQSGIFYTQIGLIKAAVPQIKSQIGSEARVIATGGFAPMFASKCESIDIIEPDLTLLGLKMLYSRR